MLLCLCDGQAVRNVNRRSRQLTRRRNPQPRTLLFVGAGLAGLVALAFYARSQGSGGLSTSATSLAQRAIVAAQAQIGKPYKWGAVGPDSFDCSGLMWYVWKQAGVNFTRTTAHALFQKLKPVARADLKPGDMVFFGTIRNLHHVGLYIGNERMIHAPHTGSTVREGPLMRDFYAGGRF